MTWSTWTNSAINGWCPAFLSRAQSGKVLYKR